jgi:hypothetical protein
LLCLKSWACVAVGERELGALAFFFPLAKKKGHVKKASGAVAMLKTRRGNGTAATVSVEPTLADIN